ncbi:MAG: DMT family transporter [Acidimicrobiales bacterium]
MLVVVLAVGAALCNALSSVLQRSAARSAPDEDSLRLRLVAYLLRRPAWFGGIVAMIGSFVLQAAALSKGTLSAVQPLLVTELLFVLGILALWFHARIGRLEWLGAVAIVVGLGGFLGVAAPTGGNLTPSPLALAGAGLGVVAIIAGALTLARRGSGTYRAAVFGVAAGAAFALTAAMTKIFTTSIVAHGLWKALAGWPPYALMVTGVAAVFLAQNAFQAGPLTSSQPALTIVDPLVSVAIGMGIFGDHLRAAGWDIFLELITFAIMALGVVLLSLSPNFTSTDVRRDHDPRQPGVVVRPLGATTAAVVETCLTGPAPVDAPPQVSGPGRATGPGQGARSGTRSSQD